MSVGKNRQELTKHIVGDIRSKEFNKPDAITLILGNPENVKDVSHQAVAKRECDAIAGWCKENGVSVKLHNNSLDETLTQMFTPASTATNRCMAEEAFFRGFIQKNLSLMMKKIRHGDYLALLIAALLFGLAHYAGGTKYVILATVAGMGYGWVYLTTKRIEGSILTILD